IAHRDAEIAEERKENSKGIIVNYSRSLLFSPRPLRLFVIFNMTRYRLTKIYTRTGDDGTTGLGGGQRVPKESERIAAYGTVDELSSFIGVALSSGLDAELAAMLRPI